MLPRPPHYAIRLGDLVDHQAEVTAACLLCAHTSPVKPDNLLQRWGQHERITHVEKRLRCTACGNRGLCSLRVQWPHGEGK